MSTGSPTVPPDNTTIPTMNGPTTPITSPSPILAPTPTSTTTAAAIRATTPNRSPSMSGLKKSTSPALAAQAKREDEEYGLSEPQDGLTFQPRPTQTQPPPQLSPTAMGLTPTPADSSPTPTTPQQQQYPAPKLNRTPSTSNLTNPGVATGPPILLHAPSAVKDPHLLGIPETDEGELVQEYTPPMHGVVRKEYDLQMISSMTPQEILAELKQANYRAESYKKAHEVLRKHLTVSLQPSRIAQLTNRITELEGHLRNVLIENKTLTLEMKRVDRLHHERKDHDDLVNTLAKQGESIQYYKDKLREYQAHTHDQDKLARKHLQQITNLETMCKRLTERVQGDAEKIDKLQLAAAQAAHQLAPTRPPHDLAPLKRSVNAGAEAVKIHKEKVREQVAILQSNENMDKATLLATKKLNNEIHQKDLENRKLKGDNDRLAKIIDELEKAAAEQKERERETEKSHTLLIRKLNEDLLTKEPQLKRLKVDYEKQKHIIEGLQLTLEELRLKEQDRALMAGETINDLENDETSGGLKHSKSAGRLPRKPAIIGAFGRSSSPPPPTTTTTTSASSPNPDVDHAAKQLTRQQREAFLITATAARRLRQSEERAKAVLDEIGSAFTVHSSASSPPRTKKHTSTGDHLTVDELLDLLKQKGSLHERPGSYADLISELTQEMSISADKLAELETAAQKRFKEELKEDPALEFPPLSPPQPRPPKVKRKPPVDQSKPAPLQRKPKKGEEGEAPNPSTNDGSEQQSRDGTTETSSASQPIEEAKESLDPPSSVQTASEEDQPATKRRSDKSPVKKKKKKVVKETTTSQPDGNEATTPATEPPVESNDATESVPEPVIKKKKKKVVKDAPSEKTVEPSTEPTDSVPVEPAKVKSKLKSLKAKSKKVKSSANADVLSDESVVPPLQESKEQLDGNSESASSGVVSRFPPIDGAPSTPTPSQRLKKQLSNQQLTSPSTTTTTSTTFLTTDGDQTSDEPAAATTEQAPASSDDKSEPTKAEENQHQESTQPSATATLPGSTTEPIATQ